LRSPVEPLSVEPPDGPEGPGSPGEPGAPGAPAGPAEPRAPAGPEDEGTTIVVGEEEAGALGVLTVTCVGAAPTPCEGAYQKK
jgi:hypothetical protein